MIAGTASTAVQTGLAFQKGAFAFATADLVMPEGVDWSAREVYDGLSMRIVRAYDINNDKFPCRLDILYGYQTLRAQLAARYHKLSVIREGFGPFLWGTMKAIDLIGRALRLLSVADANESPDAPMYQDALSVLNVMLAEWTQADIGQTDAAFATLQSTVAEQADSDAIAYQLACVLPLSTALTWHPAFWMPPSRDESAASSLLRTGRNQFS